MVAGREYSPAPPPSPPGHPCKEVQGSRSGKMAAPIEGSMDNQ